MYIIFSIFFMFFCQAKNAWMFSISICVLTSTVKLLHVNLHFNLPRVNITHSHLHPIFFRSIQFSIPLWAWLFLELPKNCIPLKLPAQIHVFSGHEWGSCLYQNNGVNDKQKLHIAWFALIENTHCSVLPIVLVPKSVSPVLYVISLAGIPYTFLLTSVHLAPCYWCVWKFINVFKNSFKIKTRQNRVDVTLILAMDSLLSIGIEFPYGYFY